jgi:hypothetical protein
MRPCSLRSAAGQKPTLHGRPGHLGPGVVAQPEWPLAVPRECRPAFLTILLYRNMWSRSVFGPFPSRGGKGPAAERRAGRHPAHRGRACASIAQARPNGAPGGAAPGRRASQTRRSRGARARGGLRNPASEIRRAGCPIARAAQRGLANPWRLPALHSLRGKEKGFGLPGADQRMRAMMHVTTALIRCRYRVLPEL